MTPTPIYPSQLKHVKSLAKILATRMADSVTGENNLKLSSFQRDDLLAKALGYKSYSDLEHSTKFRAQGDKLNEDASVYSLLSNKNNQLAIIQYYSDTFESLFDLSHDVTPEDIVENIILNELHIQSRRENFILKKAKITQVHRDILSSRGVSPEKASFLYSPTRLPDVDETILEYFKNYDQYTWYFSEENLQVKILRKGNDIHTLKLAFRMFYSPAESNLEILMTAEDSNKKENRALIRSFILMEDGGYVFCGDYEGLNPFLYVKKMKSDFLRFISDDLYCFRGDAKQLAEQYAP